MYQLLFVKGKTIIGIGLLVLMVLGLGVIQYNKWSLYYWAIPATLFFLYICALIADNLINDFKNLKALYAANNSTKE